MGEMIIAWGICEKIFRSLLVKWNSIVIAIEESKDPRTMKLET
jgi:hypothetical protein